MAVYKVIQDIEAEDKLLGPLSFKGLIYAGIAVLCAFINVRLLQAGVPPFIKTVFIVLFLLPMLLFGLLASPIGRDQPTEVWLLSRLRFFLKPRLRIWDQSGIVELVTVTAPKKIARQLTKGLTQTEVNSRLQALAATLDSRGWAVKNVTVNLNNEPGYLAPDGQTDRLVEAANVVQEVPAVNVHAADDILDADNNPTAQKFKSMMDEAEARRKQALADRLNAAKTDTEKREVEFENLHGGHQETIHDIKAIYDTHPPVAKSAAEATDNRMTPSGQAVKLELANSGNDLSVASIARLANRGGPEVAVSLH
jgi:PrgI family protein